MKHKELKEMETSESYNIPLQEFTDIRTSSEHSSKTEQHNATTSPGLQDELLEALMVRNIVTFRDLLRNPNVNPIHKYGPPHWSTCLEIACRHTGCDEFVRALLQAGVKPNINTIVPEPIHYAAMRGNDDTLKVLLWDKRTKVNAVDSFGRTALHLAAKNFESGENAERYERCIALLFSRSEMDVNHPNKKGCTAIYEAAYYGGREAVLAMLKYGSHILDLDSSRGVGRSARDIIIERYPDLKNSLTPPRSAYLHSDPHTQLLAAFRQRELNVFRDLLCQVDIYGNARLDANHWYNKPYNSTCLEMACKEIGCEEFVKALLLAGADPNTVNIITKKAPLHLAVEAGNYEGIKTMLGDRRTNVNMVDDSGKTALHIAVEQHQEAVEQHQILSLLLQQVNIDVNKVDKNGHTAIHIAALKKNTTAVQIILEQDGLELDLDSMQGLEQKTTRDVIVERFSDLNRLLPQKSVIEDRENALKETLFEHLYKRETQEFIKSFKENVKKFSTLPLQELNDGHHTFLQYASNYDLYEIVQVLLKYEANPNGTTDYDRRPPIVLACLRKNQDILKYFLNLPPESNFNINAADTKGNTALHYAAQNEDLISVVALLSHGADIKLRNIFDRPPLPATAVEVLLNHSLKTNQHFPEDDDYELIFDYSFLLAHIRKDNHGQNASPEDAIPLVNNQDEEAYNRIHTLAPEMDLLFHISQSGEYRDILKHPVVTSFLHLKWLRIRATYYTNLFLYIFFLLLLNIYILMDFGLPNQINYTNDSSQNDSIEITSNLGNSHLERFKTTYGNILWILLIFILFCHMLRELFKFVMSPSRYLLTLHNMLDITLIFITAVVLFKSWEDEGYRKLFAAFSLFLSWVELALLIGRLPQLSINIEYLKSVSIHYCFIFLSYFFIIIAFAISFYIFRQGSTEQGFSTLWTSITETIVLMTGGLYASSLEGYSYLMLFLFTFIVIMVIVNILTGIAVTHVKDIQDNEEQLRIVSKITLIYEIESILVYWNTFMDKICKFNCVSNMSAYLKTALRKVMLFPDVSVSEKQIRVMPNRNATVLFPTDRSPVPSKLNFQILKEAINIIGNKGKYSDRPIDHLRQNIHKYHNENLQKFAENSNNLDKLQTKMNENHMKVEKIDKNIKKFQNKIDKSHINMKNLIEQSQIQLTHTKEALHETLNHYEHRFNWIEQSQKQTTHLLTEILAVLKPQYEENIMPET